MNLDKCRDVFNPDNVRDYINIIGCGSVGSYVATKLARLGLTRFRLFDFDTVEAKNVANQAFTGEHIGMTKVEALRDMILEINPMAERDIIIEPKGWTGQKLSGYLVLAVDNIEVRRAIVEQNKYNTYIKAAFDVRTALFDAQLYAADWSNPRQVNGLLASMEFSHEEATAEVPVSACGVVLGVAPTVDCAALFTVMNFFNFVTKGEIKPMMVTTPFALDKPDVVYVA